MSDKLPEMTFNPGDRVWTPTAGFCVLETSTYDDSVKDSRGVLYGRDGTWQSSASRVVLTYDEAAKLGLTPPKTKRKEKRYAWVCVGDRPEYGSVHLTRFDDAKGWTAPKAWTRAPWLDGELEVEGDE